jgi:hypothetical protein
LERANAVEAERMGIPKADSLIVRSDLEKRVYKGRVRRA